MNFFGRQDLLSQLDALWRKRIPSLVSCRGRRRVGKSTLIEQFAKRSKARFLRIEGLRPDAKTTTADELAAFAAQLAAQTGCEDSVPSNWLGAFIRLSREINDREKTVVLLDEVSWMAHGDPTFSPVLKIAWDNYFKKHDRLVFVVCGSVSAWIRENILDNGAFYGRRSLDIVVPELPLSECVKFWGTRAERTDLREIVDVLSVTGGVPRYLEEIDPSATADENIRRTCFLPNAPLRTDFDEMFRDVVARLPALAGRVLRQIVDGPKSLTEISEGIGVGKGGNITAAVIQLEEAGMVASDPGKNPLTGAKVRERQYRLKDNYSRFYLKYIEPMKEMIDEGAFAFAGLEQLAGWESVMGLQFENLVVNNLRELPGPLHVGNALVLSAAPYRRSGSKRLRGVQIDLLIQTRRTIYVVEIKRRNEIGREIIRETEDKVARLGTPSGVSVRTALVYEGHLAPIVEADGYFDAIVPFRRLLGL